MAAAASFTPSLSTPSSSSSTLKTSKSKNLAGVSLGFLSSSSKSVKLLKAGVKSSGSSRSALGARMVSMPAVKPYLSLDFESSVFKKEKISLAGHDEVYFFPLFPIF